MFCSILMVIRLKVKINTKWQNNENSQFLMKVTDTEFRDLGSWVYDENNNQTISMILTKYDIIGFLIS